MKSIIVFFLVLFFGVRLDAQQANYKQADRFLLDKMWEAVFSKSVEPHYIGESDCFWYTYKTTEGKKYYLVNPSKGKQRLLFDNETMAAKLSAETGHTFNPADLSINMQFDADGKRCFFSIQGKDFEYFPATGLCRTYTKVLLPREPWKARPRQEMMLSWAPDSSYAVFTRYHNVWLMRKGEMIDKAVQVTKDGMENFSYSDDETGKGETVFTAKARWVKGTHSLFLLREDHRGMSDMAVLNNLNGRPHIVRGSIGGSASWYAMAGDAVVTQYDLSLLHADTRELIRVDINKWPDQKVEYLYTSRDGKSLYFKRVRRTCDELDICRVDVRTGEVTVVLNEVCKPYFSDRKQSITFINQDREFLWWSERSGWGHYYLYSADGTLKNAVTAGAWMADNVVKIDTQRRELLVIGHGREKGMNPYYACLYKAKLDGDGSVKLLTPEDANHSVSLTPSGRYFIDNYSRVDLAPCSVLRDRNGKLVCKLAEADLSRLFAMGWKMPERITVKAADGVTDLYGTMWKPFDFDSTRRYPIISYVYPGPTHEALDLNFTITSNHNAALAQVGFIVVNMGNRGGSPLRDRAYRTFGYGNLRDYPLADNKAGLEQLAGRYPFIDIERVGIFGHSAGGFMAAAALCTYPDFYKAAVATSGNHDNNIYNQAWVETFNGIKEEKGKDGKTKFSMKVGTNMELAKNLKGHLLLVTGDVDDNVHPAHTLRMANALIKAGKQFDMYVLPGQHHMYKGEADLFVRRKIWFYFGKYLLGDHSSDNFVDMDEYKRK